MMRFGALLVAGVLAFGCKKDEDKNEPKKDPAPATKPVVKHGEKEGKGEGGGAKAAVGAKDGTKGSAKVSAAGVERGAYLATLGGCVLCHTALGPQGPMMDKAFAGGLEVKEAFGTWRSPNITPDPETGIGTWTDEQIVAAIREGQRPDGTSIHPIMPWPQYRELTDDDAQALVAYLRTVKPVVHKVERAELPPMPLQLPPPKRQAPTDELSTGAYYASLMHCVVCHTPMTDKGPDFSKAFAGGMEWHLEAPMGTGTLRAPNITPDPETGIGKWSEEDIVKSVKLMVRPDGTAIVGPMMFYAPLWSQMKDEDARALAKFLKSLPPVKHKVAKGDGKWTMGGPPPPGGPPPGK